MLSSPCPAEVRVATSVHEAGHAVAGVVLGLSIRYVTLQPRDPLSLGHVVWRSPGDGRWLRDLVTYAAGMIAEDRYGPGVDRAEITAGGAGDLRQMRTLARRAINTGTAGDVGGGAVVRTPVEVIAFAWRHAAVLVVRHESAVRALAGQLASSPRAVTGAEVRRLVAAEPVRPAHRARRAAQAVDFWPVRFSPLTF